MDRRQILLSGATFVAAIAATNRAFSQTVDPAKLRVALLPDENAATIVQNAQPLKAYLEAALKKEIELVVTTDYSSMIEAMRFKRIEVAYFGPLSYLLAKSKAPDIDAFAVGVKHGSPTYKNVIIATANGPVNTLEDVRGKTMGFGDNASTSSHLVPRAMLAKIGLVAEKDYKPVFLGAHDAVARAVQAGQAQAGGLSQEIFKTLIEKGTIDATKVKVLAESDPIPNYPMVMQGGLAPALDAAIKKAFLDLKDPAILKTFRADGFVATDDKAYDGLRATAKILDLDLAQLKG